MKTLKITLAACGILIVNLAFSFTIFNLPIEGNYENPRDHVMVFDNSEILKSNVKSIETASVEPNMEDTIVVDLEEVVITDGFSQKSHACLQQRVKYPAFAMEEKIEGVVALTMLFNRDGNVVIVDSFGSDPRLESYVHEQLYGLHVKDCAVAMNKPFNMRFTFRLY